MKWKCEKTKVTVSESVETGDTSYVEKCDKNMQKWDIIFDSKNWEFVLRKRL